MSRSKHTPSATFRKPPSDIRIVMVRIESLNPAIYNPRKWDEAALERLTESIRKFGFVDSVIVNGALKRKNIVIGGHMRLEAAKGLGMKSVPVVYVNLPNIKQEKELNLRLNRTTGEWDWEKLKNFDVEMLMDVGFGDSELSSIWDGMLETEDDGFDVEKELEAIKKPKTKPGQLYALGNHRLLCGDATNPEDVQKLMGKVKADMIYLDPPYNITLDYNKGVGGELRLTENAHYLIQDADGLVRNAARYEPLVGEFLQEKHATSGCEHNGEWIAFDRWSVCWSALELYTPKSAEELAVLRATREQNKAEGERRNWEEDNPLLA